MIVEMINSKSEEKILNGSCGTGGFLVIAMAHVICQLKAEFSKLLGKPRQAWNKEELKAFQHRVAEMSSSNFFGGRDRAISYQTGRGAVVKE